MLLCFGASMPIQKNIISELIYEEKNGKEKLCLKNEWRKERKKFKFFQSLITITNQNRSTNLIE
jgi:hypothetical protein